MCLVRHPKTPRRQAELGNIPFPQCRPCNVWSLTPNNLVWDAARRRWTTRERPIRARTDLPICVGFGIASRDVAARVCSVADGYVVGSALGQVIESAVAEGKNAVTAAERFVRAVDPR